MHIKSVSLKKERGSWAWKKGQAVSSLRKPMKEQHHKFKSFLGYTAIKQGEGV